LKAILLAGGKGTRLQSVVPEIPKPMAFVCGTPFLEILLKNLIGQGINEITLSVGYRHEIIMDYFGDSFLEVPLNYVVEDIPLGTGGALRKAVQSTTGRSPCFVFNADTFIEVNLSEMYRGYLASGLDVGMVLEHMDDVSRYGRVTLDSEKKQVIRFEEKSGCEAGFVNMGVYILRPDLFGHFEFANTFSLEKDLFIEKLPNISIFPWITKGYFIDIGIPEDYMRAQSELRAFL
jgi:D-glycero-alpha-D-manno-heptose 1-phosphate guanylyltransferase